MLIDDGPLTSVTPVGSWNAIATGPVKPPFGVSVITAGLARFAPPCSTLYVATEPTVNDDVPPMPESPAPAPDDPGLFD